MRQSDKKILKQVRVDAGVHKLLKQMAIDQNTTMRSVIEDYFSDLLAIDKNGKYEKA